MWGLPRDELPVRVDAALQVVAAVRTIRVVPRVVLARSHQLHRLTPDAVNQRWRAIYEKVRSQEPDVLAGVRGASAALRHVVLNRIRHNPQELRPYDAGIV